MFKIKKSFLAALIAGLCPLWAFPGSAAGPRPADPEQVCVELVISEAGEYYAPSPRRFSPAKLPAYVNDLGLEFVLIPSGSFTFDIFQVVPGRGDSIYYPKIVIDRPFHLGTHEVTQRQWTAVMENNPSVFKGPDNPVDSVTWTEAAEFVARLNAREGHNRYRLPSEAEWEYAARAGSKAQFFFLGKTLPAFRGFENAECLLDLYAWFDKNSGGATHPVGGKKPNPWGLYDMFGNVWEFVNEYWLAPPAGREVTPPDGMGLSLNRVARGGAWFNEVRDCTSYQRAIFTADHRNNGVGLRLALTPE